MHLVRLPSPAFVNTLFIDAIQCSVTESTNKKIRILALFVGSVAYIAVLRTGGPSMGCDAIYNQSINQSMIFI